MLFSAVLHALASCAGLQTADVPLVMLHGTTVNEKELDDLEENARRDPAFVGRQVHNIEVLFGKTSSFYESSLRYARATAFKIREAAGGAQCIDLIGHSQGGFMTRAYVQLYMHLPGYPQVRRYVSIAGALAGYYDLEEAGFLGKPQIVYSRAVQLLLVVGGYWRDPLNFARYQETCTLLGRLSLECALVNAAEEAQMRANVLSLASAHLFYTMRDETLRPRETARLEHFKPNTTQIQPLEESAVFERLGFKQLRAAGRLWRCRADDYGHSTIVHEFSFYERYLQPVLAAPGDVALKGLGCEE